MKLELVINKDVVQGTVNEVELIESKAQRDELAGRVGVLERSKGCYYFLTWNLQRIDRLRNSTRYLLRLYKRYIPDTLRKFEKMDIRP
ncbi:hypothetical protein ACT7CU_16635 [Bacillus paranthracis]